MVIEFLDVFILLLWYLLYMGKTALSPAEFSPAQKCLRPGERALFWSVPFTYFFSPRGANVLRNSSLSLCSFSPCKTSIFGYCWWEDASLISVCLNLCCAKKGNCLYSSRNGKHTDAVQCFTWQFPRSGEHRLFQALPTIVTESSVHHSPLSVLPVSC